jgi:hypothetical protein
MPRLSRSQLFVLVLLLIFAGMTVYLVRACGPEGWLRSVKSFGGDARTALAEEKRFEPRVMIRTVQGAGTLVVHTVRFDFADPETKFARRAGKVTASAEIEYAVDLGALVEADFINIDPSHRTFTVRLGVPRPHKPRIEAIEYSDLRTDGFIGQYTMGFFGSDQRFKDEAGRAVEQLFERRLNDRADLVRAQNGTVRILNDLYKGTGWKCDVEWKPDPAISGSP